MFRNSTLSEALNLELQKTIEANRDLIESQLRRFIMAILEFLEEHSKDSTMGGDKPLFISGGLRDKDKVYSLPLFTLLERGLFMELEALYETVRDLLLAMEYIDTNSHFIYED